MAGGMGCSPSSALPKLSEDSESGSESECSGGTGISAGEAVEVGRGVEDAEVAEREEEPVVGRIGRWETRTRTTRRRGSLSRSRISWTEKTRGRTRIFRIKSSITNTGITGRMRGTGVFFLPPGHTKRQEQDGRTATSDSSNNTTLFNVTQFIFIPARQGLHTHVYTHTHTYIYTSTQGSSSNPLLFAKSRLVAFCTLLELFRVIGTEAK